MAAEAPQPCMYVAPAAHSFAPRAKLLVAQPDGSTRVREVLRPGVSVSVAPPGHWKRPVFDRPGKFYAPAVNAACLTLVRGDAPLPPGGGFAGREHAVPILYDPEAEAHVPLTSAMTARFWAAEEGPIAFYCDGALYGMRRETFAERTTESAALSEATPR